MAIGGAFGLLGSGGLYNGNIAIAAGAALNYGGTAVQTIGGVISGGGAFLQTAGFVTLANNNTFSGSFSQTAGTLQLVSGQFSPAILPILGTFIYSGGTCNSRLVNGGTSIFNSSFYPGGGIENDGSFAVPLGLTVGVNSGGLGINIDNEGTITLAGGTLAGGSAAGGGPILNNDLITGHGS